MNTGCFPRVYCDQSIATIRAEPKRPGEIRNRPPLELSLDGSAQTLLRYQLVHTAFSEAVLLASHFVQLTCYTHILMPMEPALQILIASTLTD
jgi:hypothetical protein